MPEDKNYTSYATLIRGTTYFLGTKRFEHGIPVPVTDAERDRLEEYAVDNLTAEGDGDTIERAKFRFSDIEEDAGETDVAEAETTRARAPVARGRRVAG